MSPQQITQDFSQVKFSHEKKSAASLTATERIEGVRACIAQTHAFDTPKDFLTVSGFLHGDWVENPLLPAQWNDSAQGLLAGILEYMLEDVYFSQHSFNAPNRRTANVSRLNDLWVDCDPHSLNPAVPKKMALAWALTILEENGVPAPTLWRDSGRGFYLIWLLEDTLATPATMAIWQGIEDNLVQLLKVSGGDTKAKDLSRVLRPAFSINSKSGTTVKDHVVSEERYTLQTMQDVFGVVMGKTKARASSNWGKGRKRKKVWDPKGQNPLAGKFPSRGPWKVQPKDYSTPSLGWARARDIEILNSVRGGMKQGDRQTTLFIYAQSLITAGYRQQVINDGLSLNRTFDPPLPEKEARHALRSPRLSNPGYRGAYRFRTKRIIEEMEITPEEQTRLTTLIGQGEKDRRKGTVVNATALKVQEVFEAMPGATQMQLAEAVGKSQQVVSNSLKALGLKTVSKRGRKRASNTPQTPVHQGFRITPLIPWG